MACESNPFRDLALNPQHELVAILMPVSKHSCLSLGARFPAYPELNILFVGQIVKLAVLLVLRCRGEPLSSPVLIPVVAHQCQGHETPSTACCQNGNLGRDISRSVVVLKRQGTNNVSDAYLSISFSSRSKQPFVSLPKATRSMAFMVTFFVLPAKLDDEYE